MAARLSRLLVALFVSVSAGLPSAAAALVRPPTSQEIAPSPVPARGADPANARSYFGARYYRADLGRFTTVDPVLDQQAALTDPQQWNRYAYVSNNPLKYTDPDGKNPLLITAGIGAAVYGGFAIYQNVSHGLPWYNNVGVEATKGLLVGATLGLAAPAMSAGGVARISVGVAETVAGPAASPLRQEYEAAVRGLGDRIGALEKAGMTEEAIARKLHAARRALGVEYKNQTDPALLEKIYERNMQRYGDKLGPTIEWLRNQGKTRKQIIESASRPGGKDVL